LCSAREPGTCASDSPRLKAAGQKEHDEDDQYNAKDPDTAMAIAVAVAAEATAEPAEEHDDEDNDEDEAERHLVDPFPGEHGRVASSCGFIGELATSMG